MNAADALRTFSKVVRSLTHNLDALSREDLVEIGSALYMMERGAHRALEAVKLSLRDRVRQDGASGTVRWAGSGRGKVDITIPTPTFRLRKDADTVALRNLLGTRFDDYFTTHTQHETRKGFEDRLRAAPEEERAIILNALEQVEGNPRVSFTRT